MNRVHRLLNAIKDLVPVVQTLDSAIHPLNNRALALVTQRAESAVHSTHDIRLRQHLY